MASAFERLKMEVAAFNKKHQGKLAEDFLPGAFSTPKPNTTNTTTPQEIKHPEKPEDIANMSDEEVQQYFYNDMPKSQIELAPQIKTSLFDRIDKIRKTQEANKNRLSMVESMLKNIRSFKG